MVSNVITYSALIIACEKGGQPEWGLEVFHAMPRQGIAATQKSLLQVFWTYESMRVPTWHLQGTNSCHGLPAGCGHRLPSAMDGAWLNLGPTLAKVLVLPAEDPHYFTLAVPGSHRAGPYDPGGAPYGRREHGRFRRSAGRIPRCGKGVKLRCMRDRNRSVKLRCMRDRN